MLLYYIITVMLGRCARYTRIIPESSQFNSLLESLYVYMTYMYISIIIIFCFFTYYKNYYYHLHNYNTDMPYTLNGY